MKRRLDPPNKSGGNSVIRTSPNSESISSNNIVAGPTGPEPTRLNCRGHNERMSDGCHAVRTAMHSSRLLLS
jgi:hypothetical protein